MMSRIGPVPAAGIPPSFRGHILKMDQAQDFWLKLS